MSNPYTNGGEPQLSDLKGQLWRCDAQCWIVTGARGRAFRLEMPGIGIVAELDNGGVLRILPGYVFDGSSVPLIGRWLDYHTSAWPGAVHDVAYEALRSGKQPGSEAAFWDALYRDMLHAFGAYWLTSRLCYLGLRAFGGSSRRRRVDYARRRTAA